MFFILSKTVPLLFYPVPLLILSLIAVLIFFRRKHTRWFLLGIVIFFYVISIPCTSNWLMHRLEMQRPSAQDLKPHYDAVVVLSGMVNLHVSKEGNVDYTGAIDRILTAINLVKQKRVDMLLISGGSGSLFDQRTKEAPFLKQLALEFGLRDDQIIIESRSRNTFENAKWSSRLIQEHDLKDIMLITSAFHMRRAQASFRKQGVDPDIYPVDFLGSRALTLMDFVPTSGGLGLMRKFVRESLGLIAYRLRGYI